MIGVRNNPAPVDTGPVAARIAGEETPVLRLGYDAMLPGDEPVVEDDPPLRLCRSSGPPPHGNVVNERKGLFGIRAGREDQSRLESHPRTILADLGVAWQGLVEGGSSPLRLKNPSKRR